MPFSREDAQRDWQALKTIVSGNGKVSTLIVVEAAFSTPSREACMVGSEKNVCGVLAKVMRSLSLT